MPAYQPEKFCPDCERTLPRSAFYRKGRGKKTIYLTTRCKECHKVWRKTQRQLATEQMRRWREKNREKWNAYMREWRKRNPQHQQARRASFLARYKEMSRGHAVPKEDWLTRLAAFDHACAYCGATEPLEADHFVPVVLGGSSDLENLVPSCRSCNASKSDSDPFDWVDVKVLERILTILMA